MNAQWLSGTCAASAELWSLGYTPESYALLQHGLRNAASALRDQPTLPPRLVHELDALLAEADALGAPRTRSEYSRAHAAWLERARSLAHRIRRAQDGARSKLRLRAPIWLALGAVLAVAAYQALRAWQQLVFATASAEYAIPHNAARASDDLLATEWLLPDRTLGHLDLALAAPRAVHAVTLTNAHNGHYMDRGIKRANVLVYDDDRVVDRAEVSFAAIEAAPAPVRVALHGARATRVRIQVLEHLGLGAGLAEVDVE